MDRPPGLVGIFAIAHLLGGQVALRLIGTRAAAGSVIAAAALGRALAPGRADAVPACAVLVAAVLSTPPLDVAEVDGEILALPFLLLGLVLLVHAAPTPGGTRPGPWPGLARAAGAGVAGPAAVSVRQDMLDVVVAAAVLAVVLLRRRRLRDAAVLLAGLGVGALALGGALLGLAATRGTSPASLWQAVVVLRLQAGAVITAEGSSAGQVRGEHLLLALVLTLPVRVHDPHLRAFTRLLRGPRRPEWLVVQGTSLASWGLDATTADRVAARHHGVVLTAGDLEVLHRDA